MLFLNIIENSQESAILTAALKQLKIPVAPISASYSMYLKLVQYNPSLVLIELPENPNSHLKFVSLIRTNQNLMQIPFIAFGPAQSETIVNNFKTYGITEYIPRPFDIKTILQTSIKALKNFQKTQQEKQGINKNQLDDDTTRQILDKRIPPSRRIRIILEHVDALLAFPLTIANILKVSGDEKSGAADLATVVKSDPAVSTEILRVANTIHFNRSSRRVTSIKDAIVRLGFTQTKNMAASMSVVQSMKDKNYQTGFSHQAFWLHCLGVAIVAEKLAKQSKLVSPEEAFVCGLLHDLGVMILNEFFNELFLTILEYTTDNGCRFIEAEKAILGFTHHDFLKVLLEKWNFDPTTIEGMVTYPDLTSFTVPFIKENPLSAIVNIADNLTNAFCIGQSADACIEPIPQEFMRILALPHGITSHFLDSIFHSFNIFNDFLQISKERFPDAIQPLRQLSDSKLLFYAFDRDSFFHPIEHYFRLRHSQAIFCQEEQELLDRLESAHIMCIAGAGAEHSQALAKAMSGQMLPMPSLDSSAPLSNRAKALIMNTGNAKIALTQGLNIITRYPIDVRNVQLAMAMLLNDLPVSPELSSKGFLKKQKDFDSKGNIIGNIHAMVLYNTNEFKDTLQQVLTSVHFPSPDFVNEPSKAINHAKTAQNELHCIIIEAPVTDPDTSNTVAAIKALPTHKRARFIIVDKGLEKKEIEKLKLLKIQEIIHLDALQSTLETFVNEQAS